MVSPFRSGPCTGNALVALAPNGAVLRNLGCRGQGKARWCNVQSVDGLLTGWVAGRQACIAAMVQRGPPFSPATGMAPA